MPKRSFRTSQSPRELTRQLTLLAAFAAVLFAAGCRGNGGGGGDGGSTTSASGGTSSGGTSSGGTTGSGGTTASGGTSSGGTTASGGTGGMTASGGTGGMTASGGTGGMTASGGTGGDTGTGGTGGVTGTGGTGGMTASGGTGGMTASGGTGGVTGMGGAGGVTGTGGAGGGTVVGGFGDWHGGWVQSWPSTGTEHAIGKLGGGGGATVAGTFQGTVTLPGQQPMGGNGTNGYVARFGANGQIVWVATWSGPSDVGAVDVDAAGRVFIAGTFGGSLTIGGTTLTTQAQGMIYGWAALLDTNGAFLWARSVGKFAIGMGVSGGGFGPDGNVIMGGYIYGNGEVDNFLIQGGAHDGLYAAKLSGANGAAIWAHCWGGTQSAEMTSLAVDPAGDVILTGTYVQDLDFGLGPLDSINSPQEYLAKLSGVNGTATFNRALWKARGNVTGAPGGFYFAGNLWGPADFGGGVISTPSLLPVLAAYGPTGNLLWTKTFGDAAVTGVGASILGANSSGLGVGWAITGNIDFGGGQIVGAGNTDIYVAAHPADGTTPKVLHYGSALKEGPTSFSVDENGAGLLVGTVNGPLDFAPVDQGMSLVTPQNPPDTFVLYLAPN